MVIWACDVIFLLILTYYSLELLKNSSTAPKIIHLMVLNNTLKQGTEPLGYYLHTVFLDVTKQECSYQSFPRLPYLLLFEFLNVFSNLKESEEQIVKQNISSYQINSLLVVKCKTMIC